MGRPRRLTSVPIFRTAQRIRSLPRCIALKPGVRAGDKFGMIPAMTKPDPHQRVPTDGVEMRPARARKSASASIEAGPALADEALAPTLDHELLLRESGVRITRQRRTILSILAECGGDHPDAVEIFRRASAVDPSISLSTVYRTMRLLEEKGAIQRHVFEGGPARFEGADGVHHDHLIDIETGDVVEFRSERIERLQEEIARELGYEIVSHRLELYGRKRQNR